MSIHTLSLYELHEKFTAGEVTATEIVRAYGLRIGQVEPKVKAYITQTKDAAVAQAGALDASLKGWRKTSPMMGMPLAIKDNICTEGGAHDLRVPYARELRSTLRCDRDSQASRAGISAPWEDKPR